jgi:hypothetical protein
MLLNSSTPFQHQSARGVCAKRTPHLQNHVHEQEVCLGDLAEQLSLGLFRKVIICIRVYYIFYMMHI